MGHGLAAGCADRDKEQVGMVMPNSTFLASAVWQTEGSVCQLYATYIS